MTAPTAPHAAPPALAGSTAAGASSPTARRRLDPAWARPGLALLLIGTALLYLWNLSSSGNANSFYAAAAQAGGKSWKAWFFGSLDAGNAITVDKPPASLWIMGLSVRIFGYNSWSLLVPQALEGVAAVALVHAAVKRWSGPAAGLVAGAALALTPAAALMFRFDNPDALLVLLMVAGAYCVVRALERAGTRWLVLAGVAIGFAFLTKMLQGFLVLPAFAGVYLLAAPTTLRRRVVQLLWAGVAILVSAGWWVAAVAVWPASSRPFIGGSTNNTVLELVFGYNGLARIVGGSGGGGGGMGGGAAGSSFGGATGLSRLVSNEMGNEISWLLPTAVVALAFGLWARREAPRTDLIRASLLLWGGWMLVTGVTFSYMAGTVHPYYTVALAPALAALVGIGGRELWRARSTWFGRGGLAVLVAVTAGWDAVLLGRAGSWHPQLRWALLGVAAVAVLALLLPRPSAGWAKRAALVALVAGLVSGLGGTAAFAAATAGSAHTGSIPSVGPASASSAGGFGGGGFGGGGGSATSTQLTSVLAKASSYRWAAATIGDQGAAQMELASGASVMSIGGWSGSDPSVTLAQFEAYVKAGDVRYYLASGGGMGGMGGSGGTGASITSWVQSHFTATTVGGQTVYDLASPTRS